MEDGIIMRNIYVDSGIRRKGEVLYTICYDDFITSFGGNHQELVAFMKAIKVSAQDTIYVEPHGLGVGVYYVLKEHGYNVKKAKHHKVDFAIVENQVAILK